MQKFIYFVIIVAIVVGVFLIKGIKSNHQSLEKTEVTNTNKPVIMIVIDSLMNKPLLEAVNSGRAPALQFFLKHGNHYSEVVSSYPTMSVVIDSTLLTGTYSDKHRVPGLVWYDEKEQRIVNYGSAKAEVLKQGINQVVNDYAYHLNHTHLSQDVQTIHETLAERQLQSASINALLYRGPEKRRVDFPRVGSFVNITPKKLTIKTPEIFSYGLLAQYNPKNDQHISPFQRLGFNDSFSAQELTYIIKNKKLPAFSIAYFPELDQEVHKHGRQHHIDGIEKADKQLQEVLNSFPIWEDALNSATWIVMGDSGQANIGEKKKSSMIQLNDSLGSYTIHKAGKPVKPEDQIVLGYNERMVFIYILDHKITPAQIAKKLKADERIGFLAWKDGATIHVESNGHKDSFTFQPNGKWVDPYGQSWDIQGDHTTLDLKTKDGQILFGSYPDALARLHSAMHSQSGSYLIADAKPGFEFKGEGTPVHPGGAAHGSLHAQDSYFTMIVTGTDSKPRYLRMVDFYEWILDLTGNQKEEKKL